MPPYPKWVTCSCKKSFYCAHNPTERSTLSRCRKSHVNEKTLELPGGRLGVNTTLFVILSHDDRAVEEQHGKLVAQLFALGAPKQNIYVSYGVNGKKFKRNGKLLEYNQLTHYSALFRWVPKVHNILQKRRTERRLVRAVVYMEYNTVLEVSHVTELLDLVDDESKSDICWLGFRMVHRPSAYMNRHENPVLDGSKLIVFRRKGLRKMYVAANSNKRLCHFDLMMCRCLSSAAV